MKGCTSPRVPTTCRGADQYAPGQSMPQAHADHTACIGLTSMTMLSGLIPSAAAMKSSLFRVARLSVTNGARTPYGF